MMLNIYKYVEKNNITEYTDKELLIDIEDIEYGF